MEKAPHHLIVEPFEEIKQPDWPFIVDECIKKIHKRYNKYGNSWIDRNFDLDWWEKRLHHEVAEWVLCRLDESELIDIIVVAAMIREKLRG